MHAALKCMLLEALVIDSHYKWQSKMSITPLLRDKSAYEFTRVTVYVYVYVRIRGISAQQHARCCCLTLWLSVTDAVNAYACGEFPKCTTYNSHNSSKNQLETNDFSLVCQLSLRLISFKLLLGTFVYNK
uniref:Uncharacterized protein n=1 Tax=Glossina austeni TaxID=7395 RepID=A0A1A9UEJ6_GLOAU